MEQVCDVTAKHVLVVVGDRHVCQQSQSSQLHSGVQGPGEDILADLIDVYLGVRGEKVSILKSPDIYDPVTSIQWRRTVI